MNDSHKRAYSASWSMSPTSFMGACPDIFYRGPVPTSFIGEEYRDSAILPENFL
ncbi:hypothetical protein QUF72_10355 [Desulfobacterales bacterium HSG2]|nr:hypothetical protein [Desulfobacterales bacterium HSG2]